MTRERISRILKLRVMLLLFQTGFILVIAAVVYAILESISGLESSSDTTEPSHLKLLTHSSFCPFNLLVDAAGVCHQLGVLGTAHHAVGYEGFVETLN